MPPRPPGRSGLPFLGETLRFARDAFAFFEERFREFGPVFRTKLFGHPWVCFVGPEAFAFFYDERRFARAGASPSHIVNLLHPEAVAFLDGDAHRRRKAEMLRAFTPDALAGYLDLLNRILARFAARWVSLARFRWVPELMQFCFDLADALFGNADPDDSNPGRAAVFDRFAHGLFAVPVNLPFTAYRTSLKARDELRRYVRGALDAFRPGGRPTVMARLVGGGLTRPELEIELLHLYVAAFAGIAGTLAFVALALARNPEVFRRAREEVRTAAPSGPIPFDALCRLAYVDRVGRETRRFFKLVPMTFPAVVREDCEYGGYLIPKDWRAVGVIHSTLMDGKSFPDPDRFDPDRPMRPDAWVPHGGGTPPGGHRCAGEDLATLVVDAFTALMVRDFEWELPPQDFELRMGGLVPVPKDGLEVTFRRAR
jgi:cytochrome P450